MLIKKENSRPFDNGRELLLLQFPKQQYLRSFLWYHSQPLCPLARTPKGKEKNQVKTGSCLK